MSDDDRVRQLRLLQLADSALPIGATAHSFGMETLVAQHSLTVDMLHSFFLDYLHETSAQEGAFCRVAHRLAAEYGDRAQASWLDLNRRLSARKPAREARAASATLGRRLLRLVSDVGDVPPLGAAAHAAQHEHVDVHHCTAFGLAGGALGLAEEWTVLAYLQQSLTGLVSACQRLLPLGQTRAQRLLWELKPALVEAAVTSRGTDASCSTAFTFTPLLDLGSMRHPALSTRLFIS